MLKSRLLLLLLAGSTFSAVYAQKLPTATKAFDIQAGGGFVYGQPDYGTHMSGYGFYGTVDFRPHLGVELEYHKANGQDLIYEQTYEVGPRYVWHRGRLNPYAKLMFGRGVFNFPPYCSVVGPNCPASVANTPQANLGYNLFAAGGGADYRVKSYLNVRGEFEYQEWSSDHALLPHGLTPYFGTVGVAYHFR